MGNAGGSLRFGLDQDEAENVVEHLTQAEMFGSPIVAEEGDGGVTSGDRRSTAECVSLVPSVLDSGVHTNYQCLLLNRTPKTRSNTSTASKLYKEDSTMKSLKCRCGLFH